MTYEDQQPDQVKLDKGFQHKCLNCQSTNVKIKDWRGWSEATGAYGSIDLVCQNCGQTETICESDFSEG